MLENPGLVTTHGDQFPKLHVTPDGM
jgi:hypothetical protein